MASIPLLRRLHQHRQWVNQKLLAAADQLSESQLQKSFEMGQGSLWKTLTHLYGAEYVWLEALVGNQSSLTPGDARGKLPGNQEGDDAISSLAELRSRWNELDQRWQEYLASLSAESLAETVYKTYSVSGKLVGNRRSDVLLHVCAHAQYTSAQAINMMRHVGVDDLPDPMVITLAREEREAAE